MGFILFINLGPPKNEDVAEQMANYLNCNQMKPNQNFPFVVGPNLIDPACVQNIETRSRYSALSVFDLR